MPGKDGKASRRKEKIGKTENLFSVVVGSTLQIYYMVEHFYLFLSFLYF